MRDIELYRHLLGIESPWTVTRVELNVPEQRVDVWADHGEPAPWSCPECGTPAPLYDHADERVWRHLEQLSVPHPAARAAAAGAVSDARRPAGAIAVGERAVAVHRCSSAWPSTCCGSATSRAPARFCASAGMRPGMWSSAPWGAG